MRYFRIFLAILASFCAFFAYIARLNISLSINSMISPECLAKVNISKDLDNQSLEDLLSVGGGIGQQQQVVSRQQPFIYTIEHATAAFMSRRQLPGQSQLAFLNEKNSRINSTRLLSLRPITVSRASEKKLNVNSDTSSSKEDSSLEEAAAIATNELELDSCNSTCKLFTWNEAQRNQLLSSFFYGYAMAQIPAARVAEIFGAKSLFLVVGFGAGFCSIIFPFAAKLSSDRDNMIYAYLVRIVLGATQGALFPAVYVFFCQWLPKTERPKWLPFPSAFSRIGTIAMNFIVPEILKNFGWEAVFYYSGAASLLWCCIFIVFASSEPQTSFWLSREELLYIESHMEPKVGAGLSQQQQIISASGFTINESSTETIKKPALNWFKMLTSKPVLIMSLVMFTAEWSNTILLIKLPQYLEQVFGLECKEIAQWSSIMILIFCIGYPLSGWLATKLDNSPIEWFTPITVRKLFELIANVLQATGCVLIAFNFNKTIVIGSLFMMMIGRSIVGGGQCLMPPELSKDYSGTVFAYSNTIANMAGILAPRTITWLVERPEQHADWFWFYTMSAAIFLIGGIIFCIFAENQSQNFQRNPKPSSPNKTTSLSQAQLHKIDMEPEEIFKMEAFSRVTSEPNPRIQSYKI